MAAYLYHVGQLYLNEQKIILKKIEEENKKQTIILESFEHNSKKDIEKNVSENTNVEKNYIEPDLDFLKIIESDSEVETSEEN